jgi:hypothetical protein
LRLTDSVDALAQEPKATRIKLPGGIAFQVMYLLKDGLLAKAHSQGASGRLDGMPITEDYIVTPAGREFIERWVRAQPVSADAEPDSESSDP